LRPEAANLTSPKLDPDKRALKLGLQSLVRGAAVAVGHFVLAKVSLTLAGSEPHMTPRAINGEVE
jgi:hypothetical protein